MQICDELRISDNFTKDDYIRLKLQLDSHPEIWKKAVKILYERINGRYFKAISSLSAHGNQNGFASMSLQCLLIDVFMQFRNGFLKSSEENGAKYIFFMTRFLNFERDLSECFYYNIRCGLLHSAETLNGCYLVRDKIDGFREVPIILTTDEYRKPILVVSVKYMADALKAYFDNYRTELLDPNNEELRSNFISKMDFIVMRDDFFRNGSALWNGICKYAGKELTSGNRAFKYRKDYITAELIVKKTGTSELENGDFRIPFADIKDFAKYGNIQEANRYRSPNNQIKHSAYIKVIVDSFPDKVEEYRKEIQRNLQRRMPSTIAR